MSSFDNVPDFNSPILAAIGRELNEKKRHMSKRNLPRITEPNHINPTTKKPEVHFDSPPGLDQVTLCGKTDFIGETRGYITRLPVTCWACRQYVQFVYDHRKERGIE